VFMPNVSRIFWFAPPHNAVLFAESVFTESLVSPEIAPAIMANELAMLSILQFSPAKLFISVIIVDLNGYILTGALISKTLCLSST
jgi:hypothetical protein